MSPFKTVLLKPGALARLPASGVVRWATTLNIAIQLATVTTACIMGIQEWIACALMTCAKTEASVRSTLTTPTLKMDTAPLKMSSTTLMTSKGC